VFHDTASVLFGMEGLQVTDADEGAGSTGKLEARLAYAFRNPPNQQRRVRIACTRGYHRQSHTSAGSSPNGSPEPATRAPPPRSPVGLRAMWCST
jgi:hypothetical protein